MQASKQANKQTNKQTNGRTNEQRNKTNHDTSTRAMTLRKKQAGKLALKSPTPNKGQITVVGSVDCGAL